MHLTKLQRRALEVYRWYRQHPPSWQLYMVAMIWRSSYMIYLGIVAVAVLVLLFSRFSAIGPWIYLILGAVVGISIRALLAYQQTIHLWPVLEQIIDWDKAEALLQPQATPPAEVADQP